MASKAMVDHLLFLLIGALLVMSSQAHDAWPKDKVNATLVTDAVAKGAVCVDGKEPSYAFAPGSGDGANNWMLLLNGGGWCANATDCLNWKSRGGGMSPRPSNFTGILSPYKDHNPDFYNWNRVFIKYCDGSSFMGDVEEVDQETKTHRRGARIFKAVVDELLSKGLAKASNVMLTGSSAGGLAAMLHCDSFRDLLPKDSRVKCVAGSSFFIRGKNLRGVEDREKYYSDVVKYHNITGRLSKKCREKMDPGLCFFPENFIADIKTPLFLLNPDFDSWQIANKLKPGPTEQSTWANCTSDLRICSDSQKQLIKDFGNTFRTTLKALPRCSSRGAFITSCYMHDVVFQDDILHRSKLANKSIMQAIGDWFFDRSPFYEIDEADFPANCTIVLKN